MRACWLKWVGRDWSISADYIWLNYSDANNVMATERRVFFIELLTVLFVGGNRLMIAGGIREPFNEYGRLTIWVLLTDLTERPPHAANISYALKT